MSDETDKSSWTQSFQYQSSMGSADWITEAPYEGGILPLANYDQATYDPIEANGANPNLSLAANGIIAADPYGETSNPSAPSQGNLFSTCWGANGAGLTPCAAGSITVPVATDPRRRPASPISAAASPISAAASPISAAAVGQ